MILPGALVSYPIKVSLVQKLTPADRFPLSFPDFGAFATAALFSHWILIAGNSKNLVVVMRPDKRIAIYSDPYRDKLCWLDWQNNIGDPIPANVGHSVTAKGIMLLVMHDKYAKDDYGTLYQ